MGSRLGPGGVNAGIVYIGTGSVSTGKPANVFSLVEQSKNLAAIGVYTTPANTNAFILNGIFAGSGNQGVTVSAHTRPSGALFLRVFQSDLDNGPVVFARIVPFRKVPEKTDIDIRAVASTSANASVFLSFLIWETL